MTDTTKNDTTNTNGDITVYHEQGSSQDLATLPQPETSTTALVMDTESLDKMMRLAEVMATSRVTIPKHLEGSAADCLAVVMQAMQWKMNPFAVAQKTHIVNGALGYEAQLVNAVIQSSGAISGRFHYEYQGEGNQLACRVGAVIRGEEEITWNEWLNISSVTTKNSPLWKTNPRQQIGYLQVKNWARAYCPGAILGVYTPDELDEIPPREKDITPHRPTRPAEIAAQAQHQLERTDEHEQLIHDLEAIAREHGEEALAKAWQGLTRPERVAIGAEELERLKGVAFDAALEGSSDE